MMAIEKKLKVLFLTTQNPKDIRAEWPYYQNWTLPQAIEDRGAEVSILCWQESTLNTEALALFDVISFLWCNNYHNHGVAFISFIQDVLLPAQKLSPSLRIVNDPHFILWNIDKQIYLSDLSRAGFLIPDTTFAHDVHQLGDVSELKEQIRVFSKDNTPVVLKPSISGSSKQTYLIQNPSEMKAADLRHLDSLIQDGTDGSLLIQNYEAGIEGGEYSMVFIAGVHTHTMVKTPCKGEFRCQAEFGGGIYELESVQVPKEAVLAAHSIIRYLEDKFPSGAVYARIDGVIRSDGSFVLMEVEAIEPHLWLETATNPDCREALYQALLQRIDYVL